MGYKRIGLLALFLLLSAALAGCDAESTPESLPAGRFATPVIQFATPTVQPAPTPTPKPVLRADPTPSVSVPTPAPTARPAATVEPAAVTPRPTPEPTPVAVHCEHDSYLVLYAQHGDAEYPVMVQMGSNTAALAENRGTLLPGQYRIEQHSVSNPGDADGDGVDDLTELRSPGSMSPVNSAAAIDLEDGAVSIADDDAFDALGVYWNDYDTVKFVLFGLEQGRPAVVFLNAEVYEHHEPFAEAIGLKDSPLYENRIRGYLVHGHVEALDRKAYHFHLLDRDIDFDTVERAYTVLAANVRAADDGLLMWVRNYQIGNIQPELSLYRDSHIPLLYNHDVYGRISFEALNSGTAYGLLRAMAPGDRPHPRDIVIYESLPNNMPLVSGVITTVPQTPLSHVNLRAVQNNIPNAYLPDVLDDEYIQNLLGRYVFYEVIGGGGYGDGIIYSIRPATKAEVDAHFEDVRPAQAQTPERDLSVTWIAALDSIGFHDADAYGVKAANVGELRKLGFPAGTVPNGFAIPFYFYDEFMKHNRFYARIEAMLAAPEFQADLDVQREMLAALRRDIEDADTPAWIVEAIQNMNTQFDAAFGAGLNRRYRSSTNNEDLPGFNGAGLYDSKSQKPSEDREDLAKSLKEVYASLWNHRAFVERDFHRVDHLAAQMGVLVHPSYRGEIVNGVAASFDPSPGGGDGDYYVNSQLGENMVTNPEAGSLPEELRLSEDGYEVIETSSLLQRGALLMTDEQIGQLYWHLKAIHSHFQGLYGVGDDERFAMEIEFKITAENVLAIKQARPWTFPAQAAPVP